MNMKPRLNRLRLLCLIALVLTAATVDLGLRARPIQFVQTLSHARSAAATACRLPISGPGIAGFVSYPSGQFSRDASISPKTTVAYDNAVGRWLPVPFEWLSPDGLSYAAIDYASGVITTHLAGTLAITHTYDAQANDIIGWDARGIFFWTIKPVQTKLITPSGGIVPVSPIGVFEPEHLSLSGLWSVSHAVTVRDETSGVGQNVRELAPSSDAPAVATRFLGFNAAGDPVTFEQSDPTKPDGVLVSTDRAGRPTTLSQSVQSGLRPHLVRGDTQGLWVTSNDGSLWIVPHGSATPQRVTPSIGAYVIAGRCS